MEEGKAKKKKKKKERKHYIEFWNMTYCNTWFN